MRKIVTNAKIHRILTFLLCEFVISMQPYVVDSVFVLSCCLFCAFFVLSLSFIFASNLHGLRFPCYCVQIKAFCIELRLMRAAFNVAPLLGFRQLINWLRSEVGEIGW